MLEYFKLFLLLSCLLGFAGSILGLLSFFAFDAGLSKLVQTHSQRWIELGKPCGFFWFLKLAAKTTSSCQARRKLFFHWQWSPQTSLQTEDPPLADILRLKRYSRLSLFFFFGALLFLFLVLVISWTNKQ